MAQTDCSDTSAYKIQTPGNYSEESRQYSEHGESLKSRRIMGPSHEEQRAIIIVSGLMLLQMKNV